MSNREYKSDVFAMLMEYPEYALDVYKALGGKKDATPEMVEIKTLEKGISLSVRNDAAFIIDTDLYLCEHQSTYNPNMPLRSLIYLTETLRTLIKGRDLYGRTLITIPRPQFIVLYNGDEGRPEIEYQRLSNSYYHIDDEDNSVELVCKIYNINPDMNTELKESSYVLNGYMELVNKVREIRNDTKDSETIVEEAVDYCIRNNILKDFFNERKEEVIKRMAIDMTFEAREKIFRKEEYEDGLRDGIKQGIEQAQTTLIMALIKDGAITKDEVSKYVDIPEDKLRTLLNNND